MGIERQHFAHSSSFESYRDTLQVELRQTENPGWFYVTVDAGDGISFKTVVEAKTGRIVDSIEENYPLGMGQRAAHLLKFAREAIQDKLKSLPQNSEGSDEFWSISEQVRNAQAKALTRSRGDHLSPD
jgi:hypothetical protein